jgi:hypothetical protein
MKGMEPTTIITTTTRLFYVHKKSLDDKMLSVGAGRKMFSAVRMERF